MQVAGDMRNGLELGKYKNYRMAGHTVGFNLKYTLNIKNPNWFEEKEKLSKDLLDLAFRDEVDDPRVIQYATMNLRQAGYPSFLNLR